MTPLMLAACAVSPEVRAQVATATAGTAPPSSGQKFAKVCEKLWAAFLKGAGTTPVAPDVINAAVELSAQKIASNLGVIPDDGEDVATMFCAWRCGGVAAEKAKVSAGPITDDIYREAFQVTHDEMGEVWRKLGLESGRAC